MATKLLSRIKQNKFVAILSGITLLSLGAWATSPTIATANVSLNNSDIVNSVLLDQAGCQATLDKGGLSIVDQAFFTECVRHDQQKLDALGSQPTPTPSSSPSSSPTPSPSNSPTAGPTTPAPTTPAPSPTPSPTVTSPSPSPSSSGFPDGTNTGVPAGTNLTTYTGPCGITRAGTVIDAKIVNCDLHITTTGVVIKNSKINGSVGDDETDSHSFSITDSEVSAGAEQNPAVWHTNYTVLRSNIHGGQTAVGCVDLCVVKDSWLHGQIVSVPGQHFGGFLSNGGGSASTPSLIQHSTIACDVEPQGSGSQTASCSGDINLYGDFGGVKYYTFDNNLFVAAVDSTGSPIPSYCVYGGSNSSKAGIPDHIVFKNNIIQNGKDRTDTRFINGQTVTKTFPGWCGFWKYGIADWDGTRPGNVWTNNFWTDGAPALPDGSPPA